MDLETLATSSGLAPSAPAAKKTTLNHFLQGQGHRSNGALANALRVKLGLKRSQFDDDISLAAAQQALADLGG